jgi:hypothetical protein
MTTRRTLGSPLGLVRASKRRPGAQAEGAARSTDLARDAARSALLPALVVELVASRVVWSACSSFASGPPVPTRVMVAAWTGRGTARSIGASRSAATVLAAATPLSGGAESLSSGALNASADSLGDIAATSLAKAGSLLADLEGVPLEIELPLPRV